ncbi:MAG: protein kinase [Planctomycetota bacterium]|nr:protein kinase [Planctomycetota bacterium]
MSRPSSDEPRTSALDDLVVECLDRLESEGDSAIDALCARHPEHASALQSRIRTLRAAGLIQGVGATGSASFPEKLGDFELVARLGAGGMGVVYRARQVSLGREVALKLIRPEHLYFEGARERFRREVEATARLQHPGIVPVYTVGEERGVPYFAMELVAGASLGDVLERLRGRDPATLSGSDLLACLPGEGASPLFDGTWCEVVARIVREVAEALEHAHRRGILHRDLKPSNVMVTRGGRVLLVDFGLSSNQLGAQQGAQRLTRSGSQLGSLPYMPPEIVAGGAAASGARGDVYSLGVTLYELLTHALPFAADSSTLMLQRIAEGRAVPPRRRNASIPRDLEVVCSTAMEHEPSRRYASAADLAGDLTRILERRPIEARPAGPLLRIARLAQRRPAHAAAALLAALLVLGVPTVLWFQQRAANRDISAALDEARGQRDRARASVDVAAQSIEDLLSRVGESDLDDVPGMERIRRKILEDALALNEDLMRYSRDDDSGGAHAAVARARVGEVRRLMGRNAEAAQILGEALEVLEHTDASALRPGEVEWNVGVARIRRAQALRDLGRNEEALADAEESVRRLASAQLGPDRESGRASLQRHALAHAATTLFLMGRKEEGIARQREGIAIARREVAAQADADTELMLGASLCSLSYQLIESGRFEEAQAALEEAIAVEEKALARDPVSRLVRSALADALINLGSAYWRQMDPRGAIPHYRRALAVLETLVRDFPSNTDHATALNDCRASLAGALSFEPETREEALKLMRAAVASQEALCAARPEEVRSRATWAIATANLGALTGETDPDAGIALFRRAMEILETVRAKEPASPQWSQYLGEWWLGICEIESRRGALERAVEAIETSQRIFPAQWRTLRRLAGKWVMLAEDARTSPQLDESARESLSERWLQRGFTTFQASVDAGYRDVADLQGERALEPLRALPQWMELEQRVLDLASTTGG